MFKGLFGNGDILADQRRKYKPIPLKKKGDIEYEVQWRTADIENDGHKVIRVAHNQHGEAVMIYRLLYHDGMDDETIHLRAKVISKAGVRVPDSNAHLIVNPDSKQMNIADIKVEGERVNRGYGSVLMEGVMKLVDDLGIRFITGWISSVDWDHIDRLEHFYRKFGFECDLDHEAQSGKIVWFNKDLGVTREDLII